PLPRASRTRRAARRAARGCRARLLRRLEPHGDRRQARPAARHGEDTDSARDDEAARCAVGRREPAMRHTTLTSEQETLAALYALDSLDAEEAAAFERHLIDDACDVCRRQVDAMAGVCGDLAIAPEPVAPSPAVRSRILREIGGASGLAFAFASDGE